MYKSRHLSLPSCCSLPGLPPINEPSPPPIPDVIYVSAAGSMLCQIVNSLLLLPVSVARSLLSYLLDLLPPLDCLNRLLPAAVLLEDQELQWPLHGKPGSE